MTIRFRSFEVSVEFGGVYVRLGQWDFDWSRAHGLIR